MKAIESNHRIKSIVLIFAVAAVGALLVSCGGSSGSSASGSGTSMQSTGGSTSATTIDLVAKNIAFNTDTITVPAGKEITINFDNQDSGIQHNFAVYDSKSANTVIFQGKLITGQDKTTYTFTAPSKAGTYFFRCDVHPQQMTGSLVVQ